MKRLKLNPTLDNILKLFAERMDSFSGESKRSYQKAFSSLQLFLISRYDISEILTIEMIEDWIIHNYLQGLSPNTISFYLDKIASLHSGIANKLITGKTDAFKIVKLKLRENSLPPDLAGEIREIASTASYMKEEISPTNKTLWGCIALNVGIPAGKVRSILGEIPDKLRFLDLCKKWEITSGQQRDIEESVRTSLEKETMHWYAMRLRPHVRFNDLIDRFSLISKEISLPELFYPYEDIALRVGRKLVWKGRPVIRDVVFFKTCKSSIYPLFTRLYDLAWCYKSPGAYPYNYAPIPDKAMDQFRNAIGFLSPEFEVMPAGEMKLRSGDKVVIVKGDYEGRVAEIIKGPDEYDTHKIFRVSLLNSNSRWDIGIDARLLRPQPSMM